MKKKTKETTKKKTNNKTEIPPIKENDIIEIFIINKGRKGDGVARYQNYVVFTPNTETDKKYKVQITKICPKYCYAKVINEIT